MARLAAPAADDHDIDCSVEAACRRTVPHHEEALNLVEHGAVGRHMRFRGGAPERKHLDRTRALEQIVVRRLCSCRERIAIARAGHDCHQPTTELQSDACEDLIGTVRETGDTGKRRAGSLTEQHANMVAYDSHRHLAQTTMSANSDTQGFVPVQKAAMVWSRPS